MNLGLHKEAITSHLTGLVPIHPGWRYLKIGHKLKPTQTRSDLHAAGNTNTEFHTSAAELSSGNEWRKIIEISPSPPPLMSPEKTENHEVEETQ